MKSWEIALVAVAAIYLCSQGEFLSPTLGHTYKC